MDTKTVALLVGTVLLVGVGAIVFVSLLHAVKAAPSIDDQIKAASAA